jgi:hypothetical protein
MKFIEQRSVLSFFRQLLYYLSNAPSLRTRRDFFFFGRGGGLNSGPSPWATPLALFSDGFVQDRVYQTISPVQLPTENLLISASWVARIIGLSHWHPARRDLFLFWWNWGLNSVTYLLVRQLLLQPHLNKNREVCWVCGFEAQVVEHLTWVPTLVPTKNKTFVEVWH